MTYMHNSIYSVLLLFYDFTGPDSFTKREISQIN
jgi:hypothetical protein